MDLKIYTVSALNKYIKMLFDNDGFFKNVAIKGEITNFKAHFSGHLYFTLKDETSTIKCIMFKSAADKLEVKIQEGSKVVVIGQINVYEAAGTYQVYVKKINLEGVGDLYLKYEALKKKLLNEGLFDENKKKKIPYLPKRVGVITSATGSVIKDIINVSTRRYKKIDLLLYPASVQGTSTAKNIIEALDYFNSEKNVDVIIIARGGGSFEDLFGFNDEELARKIYESNIPIVSGVGHETDFTICDFVSDMRAPTPSAAAEIVFPKVDDIYEMLNKYKKRINTSTINIISNKKNYLNNLKAERLEKTPRHLIVNSRLKCDNYINNIEIRTKEYLKTRKQKYISLVSLLDSFSPLKTIQRGYSVVQDENLNIVKSIKNIKIGDKIKIKVEDGNILSTVEEIN